MEMGLHLDTDQAAATSAEDKERRRRLWFALMELDLEASAQRNLPCAFSWEAVLCPSPSNLNDCDIKPNVENVPPSYALEVHTENHLQAYAWSTLEIRTRASKLLARLPTFGGYDKVLEIGNELKQKANSIVGSFYAFPPKPPIVDHNKWYHQVRLDLHAWRLPLLALYRPFALGHADCPPAIQHEYLASCIFVLDSLNVDHRAGGLILPRTVKAVFHEAMADAVDGVCHFIKRVNQAGWSHRVGGHPAAFGWAIGHLLNIVDLALANLLGFVELCDSGNIGNLVVLSIVREIVDVGTLDEKVAKVQHRLEMLRRSYTRLVTEALVSCLLFCFPFRLLFWG